MRSSLLTILSIASVMSAEPQRKMRVFLAGAEPETISAEGSVGDARTAVDVKRTAASYDIESLRTFSRNCPNVVMTTRRDNADIVIRIEREEPSPTTPFVKGNKIAVFNLQDELVYATRARLLTNASKDACRAIEGYVKQ